MMKKIVLIIVIAGFSLNLFAQNEKQILNKVVNFLYEKKEIFKKELPNKVTNSHLANIYKVVNIDTCKNISLYSFARNGTHASSYYLIAISDSVLFLDNDDIFVTINTLYPFINNKCNNLKPYDKNLIMENLLFAIRSRDKNRFRKW